MELGFIIPEYKINGFGKIKVTRKRGRVRVLIFTSIVIQNNKNKNIHIVNKLYEKKCIKFSEGIKYINNFQFLVTLSTIILLYIHNIHYSF